MTRRLRLETIASEVEAGEAPRHHHRPLSDVNDDEAHCANAFRERHRDAQVTSRDASDGAAS
jgi:hypothetical protein